MSERESLKVVEMLLQSDIEQEIEQDTDIVTEQAASLEPPWRVFVHNDDVTPYDFVLTILQRIFELNPLEAEHVTYVAHTSGIAYVATLPKTEAEKRVGKAHFAASLEGYPLTFTIEPE
jgi:ATP-dependent Clp protease adaptor protein ClpS